MLARFKNGNNTVYLTNLQIFKTLSIRAKKILGVKMIFACILPSFIFIAKPPSMNPQPI